MISNIWQKTMEREVHMQLDLSNGMPVVNDGIPPQMSSESLMCPSFSQRGTQNENMIGLPVLSSFQGGPFKNLHANRTVSYDGLLNRGNSNFHELCLGGSSLPSGSLGSILASRNSLNNDLIGSVVPLQQEVPSESLREMFSSNCSYASSSSVPTRINCGYDSLLGEANGKWDQNRFLMQPDLSWRASTSGLEHIRSNENQDGNQWVLSNSANVCTSLPYGIPMSHNELSLSLATCEASLSCSASVQGCCSDMSCSSVICNSQSQARLGSDRGSQGNRELSLEFASNSRRPQFSHEMISGSKYLTALQQILSEVACYSFEGIEQTRCSTGLLGSSSNSLVSSKQFNYSRISFKGASEFSGDESFEAPAESSNQRQEVDVKKSQLLSLLELVDDCYTRCLDEIHTVISAFHAAAELDPRVHPCFALQTVSFYYKSLREKISNEILVMGMDNGNRKGNMKSFEKAFIQKQWTLQQLKRKDQQLWRPQRGLPERSVSVLRAWMFENFLHPYPKDAEKHLLAIKSGLTRSQVSNWFINARVRLWKPLVEEMCAELNRRKGVHQNDEITNDSNTRRSHVSIYDYNQRFNT